MLSQGKFYRQWIVANAWAESVGLGTTFVIGRWLATRFEKNQDVLFVLAGALFAVLLGTFLEGVLIGVAQERVLRRRLCDIRRFSWVKATAAGAGLAWLLGMFPSTVMSLMSEDSAGQEAVEPNAYVQFGLAVILGLVAGPILGLVQCAVLRLHVKHASYWLWANALAWAIGMPLIFLGMDFVPWNSHWFFATISIYIVCGIAGLVVGAVHGRVLIVLTD